MTRTYRRPKAVYINFRGYPLITGRLDEDSSVYPVVIPSQGASPVQPDTRHALALGQANRSLLRCVGTPSVSLRLPCSPQPGRRPRPQADHHSRWQTMWPEQCHKPGVLEEQLERQHRL